LTAIFADGPDRAASKEESMQDAHLRMGSLEFTTAPGRKSTGIHIRLPLDRIILEPAEDREPTARCHMFSVVGGAQDVTAVAAALAGNGRFIVDGPGVAKAVVAVGENAKVFRSSITIPGRKNAVRHLVVVSEELSSTQAGAGTDAERTILCDDDMRFMLYRLGVRFGLPVLPEWGEWVVAELARRRALTPLIGLGCRPVLVNATKASLLKLLSGGLRRRHLTIPDVVSTVSWNLPGRFRNVVAAADPTEA
jgi:hypothetical protein